MYELVFYFFAYSFIGWTVETIYESTKQRRLVKRGFLYGFICPIYGTGMLLILLLLSPIKQHYVLLFLSAMLVATTVEYLVGWLLETIYHTRWWDYDDYPLNLHGRICLPISLCWGAGAFTAITFVHPQIVRLVDSVPDRDGYSLLTVILVVFAADFVASIFSALGLSKKLVALANIKDQLWDYFEQSEIYGTAEDIITTIKESRISELITRTTEFIMQQIAINGGKGRERLTAFILGISDSYKQLTSNITLSDRRFLRAYPKLKLTLKFNVVDELRALIAKSGRKNDENTDEEKPEDKK
ncbi:MAG: putative ABC transporter permease [Eubacteriales bacterium]